MDTHLKERLVGAAVLVAVAVILIPEMLSGPAERQAGAPSADRLADEGGVRTYTIDLGTRARSGAENSAAPAAEIVTPAPPPESSEEPEILPATPVPDPPPAAVVEARPPPEAASAPQSVVPPAAVRETPPAPLRAEAGAKQPWAVQVGSFASQATAERLGQDLKKRGYESFVVPFKTGSQTLYRVRVGPMPDRGAADATAQKLKREGASATVVSNS